MYCKNLKQLKCREDFCWQAEKHTWASSAHLASLSRLHTVGVLSPSHPGSSQCAPISLWVSQSRLMGWMGTGPCSQWHQLLGTRMILDLMIPWQKFGLISSWKWCCLESVPASVELDPMCAILAKMNSGRRRWQLLRAELPPFFSDWTWITSRRLARRMLPRPWLWGGGISYRYAMESDPSLSMLCYPPMACAVTDTQMATGVQQLYQGVSGWWTRPVEWLPRWSLSHWLWALRESFPGLHTDSFMPFAILSETLFSGNSCRQSEECSLLLSHQME